MPRKGVRRRLAPGIYSDGSGLAATVKVGRVQREHRITPSSDLDADLVRLQRWQLRTRADLLGQQPTKPRRNTLAAAVPHVLATIPDGPARRDTARLLAVWVATPLGARPRHEIRRRDVRAQLAAWEAAGVAASTSNHRLRVLRLLFDVLDGDDDDATNPTDKIRRRPEPEPDERGTTYAIIEGVLACVSDLGYAARGARRPAVSKTKARLRVMAWTGLPPALLRKIAPAHIHWAERALDVTPRRKGKGVRARRLPLLDEAVAALHAFDAAAAYGAFSNTATWNAWRRASRRYLAQVRAAGAAPEVLAELQRVLDGPARRPYDLRHSFAAQVYEHTGRREAVADLLMHGSLQTSERYVRRAVAPVSRAALEAVAAARAVPAGASAPRRDLADSGGSRPKPAPTLTRATRANMAITARKQAG